MALADSSLLLDVETIEDDVTQTTKTYAIDFANGRMSGMVDGLEAVKQAITKMLLTERYKNLIYSDDYGCEIRAVLQSEGNTDEYLEVEIPALIEETLLKDARILAVENFNITFGSPSHDGVLVTFDVETVYGNTMVEEVI
jgi:phage baseplate assembly protein W